MFTTAVELNSGTTLALGADDLGDSSGLPHALWRSTDAATTFERLDPAALPFTGDDEIRSIAENDGVVYLFGSNWPHQQIIVWSTEDEGANWKTDVIGPGLTAWGGIVGGRPSVYAVQATDNDRPTAMYQFDGGAWRLSSLPADGPRTLVSAAVEHPNGDAFALGTVCTSPPDCAPGDEPARAVVWTSRDGGASWSELERMEGLQDAPSTMVLTGGDRTFAAITGSHADGTVSTALFELTPDGDGTLFAEWDWQGAESVVVWGVARSAEMVTTAIGVDNGDGFVPHLLLTDLNSGQQDVIDLRDEAGLHATFGLAEIGDNLYAVGVARSGDEVYPAMVEIAA
jgi:hypothetical protein